MLHSILVGTDLGETSDLVLSTAALLARASGADLHVLFSYDLQPREGADTDAAQGFFEREKATEHELADQVRRVLPPDVTPASQKVEIFVAGKALAARAEEVDADLVVLGPHRRRPVGDVIFGSTADTVIRTVACPTLTVRGPLLLPLHHLTVPCDLSPYSRGAVDVAVSWGAAFGPAPQPDRPESAHALVDLVHALPAWIGEERPQQRLEMERALAEQGRLALEKVDPDRAPEVRARVLEGDDTTQAVLHELEQHRCDLLVLATHGYGAVRRALIGSIAARIVRQAPCAALLVPPDRGAFDGD